jgi:hypothetical protein
MSYSGDRLMGRKVTVLVGALVGLLVFVVLPTLMILARVPPISAAGSSSAMKCYDHVGNQKGCDELAAD